MMTRIPSRLAGLTLSLAAALLLPGATRAQDEEAAVQHGAAVYAQLCTTCHGRYGRGNGPLADDLALQPPDFTNPTWYLGRSDEEIARELRNAPHARMAVATVLEESALRDAIAYIRRLSTPGEHVSVMAGRDIYNASCWVCHGRDGRGDGPAAKTLVGPPPRDFTDPDFHMEQREDEIRAVLHRGAEAAIHGSPMMVEWSSRLSDQQIEDVMAYLRTFRRRR
jgi:mono/diheme cytochrome c family protein